MMALFPIPVTISLPLELKMISVLFAKSSVRKSISFSMDLLSERMVFLAVANMFSLVIKTEMG